MADIDFGQLSEALNDKSDRDLRNVDNTAGADAVIDYQEPTSANNYTWYRKYASGWVEQGGYIEANGNHRDDLPVTLPVVMATNVYFKQKLFHKGTSSNNAMTWGWFSDHRSSGPDDTTTVAYFCVPNTSYCAGVYWEVKGIAAN